jgi:hypothetical protein
MVRPLCIEALLGLSEQPSSESCIRRANHRLSDPPINIVMPDQHRYERLVNECCVVGPRASRPTRWALRNEHNVYRDEQGIACMPVTERADGDAHAHRPLSPYRSEFPPAIPRRVAPQQSPLPLRRITAYTCSHEAGAIPRRPTCPEFLCLTDGVQSTTVLSQVKR